MRKSVSTMLRALAQTKSNDKAFYRNVKKTWNKLSKQQKANFKSHV
jgi:hypothetical protein